MMIGVPGAGKSYYANMLKETNDEIEETPPIKLISRDAIRFDLVSENEPYFSKEHKVYATFVNKIIECVINGCDVIADATHLTVKARKQLMREISKKVDVEFVAVFVDTPIERCIEQNDKREGRACVPYDAIQRMYNSLEPPTTDEGYESIIVFNKKKKNIDYITRKDK